MPSPLKKRKRNSHQIDKPVLLYLMTGINQASLKPEDQKKEWSRHREYILKLYTDPKFLEVQKEKLNGHRHNFIVCCSDPTPGTRPFAWWIFDAPEDFIKKEERTCDYYLEGHGGCIDCEREPQSNQYDDFHCGKKESEQEYLRRNGLLSKNEEEYLKNNESIE